MIDFFNMGGSLFMGVLILLFLLMLVIAVSTAIQKKISNNQIKMYSAYPSGYTPFTKRASSMKITIILLLIGSSLSGFAQVCTHTIPPPNTVAGGGVYHVSSDSTINDQDGSIYYLCSGVHLTVEGSAGCTYYLEDNCQLTINAQDGDIVNAKGNCTIIDNSSQSIIVNKEVSSTFSKPFMPSLGFVFTCNPMVYDYSLIGGSSPCSQTTGVNDFNKASISVYPNPTDGNFSIDLGENYHTLSVSIKDMSGRIVQSNNYYDRQLLNLKLDGPAGIYFLMIESGDKKTTIRLIKK